MSHQVKQFQFQSHSLRVEIDEDGNPLFLAKDVCDILGYANSRDAIAKHCNAKGVAKRYIGVVTGRTKNGDDANQQVMATFINEGNLYRLVIKSNKPEAEPFEAWVCDEVLPSIRKHGYYIDPNREPEQRNLFDDMPNELPPFQRVKPSLLIKLGKMSKSLAHAYLVECGVTPEYVEQQVGSMGDAAPLLGLGQPIESLVAEFASDWKQQKNLVSVMPCLGRQALRLFNYWAALNGHSIKASEAQVMCAIYRSPGFYGKRMRVSRNKRLDQRKCLMIDGLANPVNVLQTDWVMDCIAQMEVELQRLGA